MGYPDKFHYTYEWTDSNGNMNVLHFYSESRVGADKQFEELTRFFPDPQLVTVFRSNN